MQKLHKLCSTAYDIDSQADATRGEPVLTINVHIMNSDRREGRAYTNRPDFRWGSYQLNEYVSLFVTPEQARAMAAELDDFAALIERAEVTTRSHRWQPPAPAAAAADSVEVAAVCSCGRAGTPA